MAVLGFGELIGMLKKNPKKIVFTEGTDARILEAASRLLASNFLSPILVGMKRKFLRRRKSAAIISAGRKLLTQRNLTVWMKWQKCSASCVKAKA